MFLELFFGQNPVRRFQFSRQKTKYGRSKYACAKLFFEIIVSVSNICSNVLNFPAKRLRKRYVRSKYARAVFFLLYLYAAIKVLLNMRCFLSYLSFQGVFTTFYSQVIKIKCTINPLLVVLLLFIITDKII